MSPERLRTLLHLQSLQSQYPREWGRERWACRLEGHGVVERGSGQTATMDASPRETARTSAQLPAILSVKILEANA